jgi:hypothetical protein
MADGDRDIVGVWLCLMPLLFGYPLRSFAGMQDVLIGTACAVTSRFEVWACPNPEGEHD